MLVHLEAKAECAKMMALQVQLTELFAQRSGAPADAAVASRWAGRIHDAFYGASAPSPRVSNRFVELESTLAQTFAGLSAGSESDFWGFAVLVVLRLAQPRAETQAPAAAAEAEAEQTQPPLAGAANSKPNVRNEKEKKKRSQPNAPLAFMVVNALRVLTTGDSSGRQLTGCRAQGEQNEALRDFCVRGLRDAACVVRVLCALQ